MRSNLWAGIYSEFDPAPVSVLTEAASLPFDTFNQSMMDVVSGNWRRLMRKPSQVRRCFSPPEEVKEAGVTQGHNLQLLGCWERGQPSCKKRPEAAPALWRER